MSKTPTPLSIAYRKPKARWRDAVIGGSIGGLIGACVGLAIYRLVLLLAG